jgi:hypothetical protein
MAPPIAAPFAAPLNREPYVALPAALPLDRMNPAGNSAAVEVRYKDDNAAGVLRDVLHPGR